MKKTLGFLRESIRILLILLIFSTIVVFWYTNKEQHSFHQYIAHATEMRVITEDLAEYAAEAVSAKSESSFDALKAAYKTIDEQVGYLKNGRTVDQKLVLPQSPESIRANELSQFMSTWALVKPRINDILNNQAVIVNLNMAEDRLENNLVQMQSVYWSILQDVETGSLSDKRISMIARQVGLIESVLLDIRKSTTSDSSFRRTLPLRMKSFFENIELTQNNGIQASMAAQFKEIENRAQQVRDSVDAVSQNSLIVAKVDSSASEVFSSSPMLSSLADSLQEAYVNFPKNNRGMEFLSYFLGVLSLALLGVSTYLFRKENALHLRTTEKINQAMQLEIDKLLKQLPDIAKGKLLIEKDDGSGGTEKQYIPESFSYALDTLRRLVYRIGRTANSVSEAALSAQHLTKELAVSSGNQAQEIVEITASVNSMASSIELVSTNAAESATVALDSVNIAGEGGKMVRGTISGMERIQTQIQETSNYMRRLSDSSQEIGEIVSLIDGIADQTNILSLNASIQAAMAGEAGRGFAVVADEVQRLAEKVSYATKEIGSLVRSIQTDTNQVIVAMDQTKSQVSEGVHSAQDAGSTLEKIETVSTRLSDLIQNISSSASEQARVSGKISRIMNDVKDISKKTASGTMTTVDLIGDLARFTTDLRNSVVDFKALDDEEASE